MFVGFLCLSSHHFFFKKKNIIAANPFYFMSNKHDLKNFLAFFLSLLLLFRSVTGSLTVTTSLHQYQDVYKPHSTEFCLALLRGKYKPFIGADELVD